MSVPYVLTTVNPRTQEVTRRDFSTFLEADTLARKQRQDGLCAFVLPASAFTEALKSTEGGAK
jgi:hypothetical protein